MSKEDTEVSKNLVWKYNKEVSKWYLYDNHGFRFSVNEEKLTDIKLTFGILDDLMALEKFVEQRGVV